MKTNIETSPRIYVGTYGKYNSGSIKGAWIDIDGLTKEEFYDKCRELHSGEHDPEFMFQDFEGFPRAFYDECHLDENLWEWLSLDDYERKLVAAYIEARGETASLEDAQDAYAGTADSGADFAQNMAEDTGCITKDLPNWIVIDWEATWNCNLRYDYHTAEIDGEIWFFYNH